MDYEKYRNQLMGPESLFYARLRRKIEIIDTLIAMTLVALSILCLFSYQFFKTAVTQQILAFGAAGLFISSAFLEFVPQVLNPYLVILVGIASGIGVYIVTVTVILGSVFGSVLGFELGNVYGPRLITTLLNKDTTIKLLDFWEKHGRAFVFVSALTPVPYVPLLFGSLKMPRRDFWLWGILPRMIGFIIIGFGYYFGLFQYNL